MSKFKKLDEPSILEFLQIITSETLKIENILEDLFLYVDNDKLDKRPYQINELLKQSAMLFHGQIQKKGIHCKLHLTDKDPTMNLDGEKLKKVFHHLFKNAIEAMENGGEVVVSSEVVGDQTKITFSDNGIGVEKGTLSRTKDAFYTTKTYGTGMGLAIVERILQMHQATFNLHHNKNGGIDVVILL